MDEEFDLSESIENGIRDNAGQLAVAGALMAHSQRQNQLRALEATRLQQAEIAKTESHRLSVENKRLELEHLRHEADKAERVMRFQKEEEVRQLRNLMVESMDVLDSVKKSLAVQSVDESSKEIALKRTAALQAQLKILESKSDILSDISDMKELRLYKSRLVEYIEDCCSAGILPSDPFQVVYKRLIAVSRFFTAAEKELNRLVNWQKIWMENFTETSLSKIQNASKELSELFAEIPQIQERLQRMLSPQDWDTSSSTTDLHPDLITCAQCVNGLNLPEKSERRRDLYQFSEGKGNLNTELSNNLLAVGQKLEELIEIHTNHELAIDDAKTYIENEELVCAQNIFLETLQLRFLDLDYNKIELEIKKKLELFDDLLKIQSKLSNNLKVEEINLLKIKLEQIRCLINNEKSVFGKKFSYLQRVCELRYPLVLHNLQPGYLRRLLVNVLAIFSNLARQDLAREKEFKAFLEKQTVTADANEDSTFAVQCGISAGDERNLEISPGVMMTFCWCPRGEFLMGSPETEKGRYGDENQVYVALTKGFWMAKTQVTQRQWVAIMGDNPSQFKGGNLPVENVSWNDAQKFLEKLNTKLGLGYRWKMALPTEAQWEYACRAGGVEHNSSSSIDEVAWYEENSDYETHLVGLKHPNVWGLHDMYGNVWEWCEDWYAYCRYAGDDPTGPYWGTQRVVRGEAWASIERDLRASRRGFVDPSLRDAGFGFRVAGIQLEMTNDSQKEIEERGIQIIAPTNSFIGMSPAQERYWEISSGIKMTFCWCPPGNFIMEPDPDKNELDYHVTFTKGFWMAKTQVTQRQWVAIMGDNPSQFKGGNLPVENVSWNDAQKFLEKLNAKLGDADGGKMTLPTEAQWEYAARAGEKEYYLAGTIDAVAWCRENSRGKTHPVGLKQPNGWGLHDMYGNVTEWCVNWEDEDSPGGGVDPRGPYSGTNRVCRGGSWNAFGRDVYCYDAYNPTDHGNCVGFRVVRIADS